MREADVVTILAVSGLLAAATACGPTEQGGPSGDASADAPVDAPAAGYDAGAAAGGTVHEYAYLTPQVDRLLAFLAGDAPAPTDLFADSVTLMVAPEGGGATAVLGGASLADRSAWRVGDYAFAPPADHSDRQVSPGLHWNCSPTDLATRFPALAELPHVGVRLAPSADATCLQTWNATFVFDRDAESPRLTAVVYDQWEW
jgi:hypothetical protein